MTDSHDDEQLTHVGWWCWRGDNHGHLATMACRSDNVPIHVPADWADEMRAVIQRIEDGDEHDVPAPAGVAPAADQAERRARYAAAIRENDGWVLDDGQHMLDAVMAVADAEQAALRAEVAQLAEASRRLLEQRQEMAEERFAWQERGDRAERRAEAMERAMESTAADALKHRGCHRDLMGQCLRAERAEAAIERVRRLCELTIGASCRAHAVQQALDTLDALAEPSTTAQAAVPPAAVPAVDRAAAVGTFVLWLDASDGSVPTHDGVQWPDGWATIRHRHYGHTTTHHTAEAAAHAAHGNQGRIVWPKAELRRRADEAQQQPEVVPCVRPDAHPAHLHSGLRKGVAVHGRCPGVPATPEQQQPDTETQHSDDADPVYDPKAWETYRRDIGCGCTSPSPVACKVPHGTGAWLCACHRLSGPPATEPGTPLSQQDANVRQFFQEPNRCVSTDGIFRCSRPTGHRGDHRTGRTFWGRRPEDSAPAPAVPESAAADTGEEASRG